VGFAPPAIGQLPSAAPAPPPAPAPALAAFDFLAVIRWRSFVAAVLTEIYLCSFCSCPIEVLRRFLGGGQGTPAAAPVAAAAAPSVSADPAQVTESHPNPSIRLLHTQRESPRASQSIACTTFIMVRTEAVTEIPLRFYPFRLRCSSPRASPPWAGTALPGQS
jgi:hypothetical protein